MAQKEESLYLAIKKGFIKSNEVLVGWAKISRTRYRFREKSLPTKNIIDHSTKMGKHQQDNIAFENQTLKLGLVGIQHRSIVLNYALSHVHPTDYVLIKKLLDTRVSETVVTEVRSTTWLKIYMNIPKTDFV